RMLGGYLASEILARSPTGTRERALACRSWRGRTRPALVYTRRGTTTASPGFQVLGTVNVRRLSEPGLDSHAGGTVLEKECRFSCADPSDGIEASVQCRNLMGRPRRSNLPEDPCAGTYPRSSWITKTHALAVHVQSRGI